MRPPPVPPPVLKRPHAQPPPQGRRAPFAAPRRPGCGHRDRELRGRPGPGAVPPAVPHSPAVPRPPRELRAVTPWPLSLCCCACRLRCCGETEAPPCPGGGLRCPMATWGVPVHCGAPWHVGGTGGAAPEHPGTPLPLPVHLCGAHPVSPTAAQPDPTRPDPCSGTGVLSVCPSAHSPAQPSTAQHCTALHSTACGPAGTFPHRVPGLWGCGVMGWRCWGGGAGRGLPAAHVVHSWDCSLPPPFRLGGLPLLHGAACAHHVLTVTHPCGAEKGCPPPEVPGTSGCCRLPPRPRCCCEGLPVSSSVPGIPAVPPAHGRGGGTPTDGRSPPGSAASDVCCEHSSARRALNHPAERSVMEDGGCAAVMAAPWGGGRWMRCCREALLSAPPSLPPRHRSLVGTAALWVPFVPVVPTPVLCGRWGSAGGAPLSRPH